MPKVFDLIRPLDERDTYAITDVIYQKGGLREVENIQERDAITIERRSHGMITFISSTSEFYALTGTDLTNNSWKKIDFSKNLQNELNIKEFILLYLINSSAIFPKYISLFNCFVVRFCFGNIKLHASSPEYIQIGEFFLHVFLTQLVKSFIIL